MSAMTQLSRNVHTRSNLIADNKSFINDIRTALSNTWDGKNDGYIKEEILGVFTDQIDCKNFADHVDSTAKKITSNASMLLEELELYGISSSPSSFNLDDVALLGDFSRLDESYQTSFLNESLAVGDSWLQGIQYEVSIIESWEDEAEKLSLIAIAAFQNLKNDTTNTMENATTEALSILQEKADVMYLDIQSRQEEKKRSQRARHLHSANSILLDDETWTSGGFQVEEVIPPEIALEIIKSIPLKSYKLRDDKQRDLGVNKDERRTRYHVGVIDRTDNITRVEPSAIFSYNIGAVSELASSWERLLSKIRASSSFFLRQSALKDKVLNMKAQTETQGHDSIKSPSQLASEIAALETEATLTRITRLSQSVLQSVRVNLIYSRFMSQLKHHAVKSQSSERVGAVERESISSRENHAETAESYLDQLTIHFEAMDKIKNVWNSTQREMVEMNEEADIESHIAKEEINAEATVERENESTSLEQIQLVGTARINEIIHAIENIFWHLAGCMQHIITPVGRQQFLFFIGAAAVLVFVVSTMKEMITLGCICILRLFTAPRLVREYGNLRTRANWCRKHNTKPTKEIVLPSNIKERMDIIVKVASAAAERRFPLRSVLIHGKPGSGKSMVAKAIAQSIPSLPYALMSGADVFPMGSQGPAELRRLLTWASKKRHGGIILIDEAESALGSRATIRQDKTGSDGLENDRSAKSSGYSRDCLNVLLSMTGSFGNVMLILTTSSPSKLDEAVLDRMDEIIHLPLPSTQERKGLLRNQFFRQFKQLDDDNQSFANRLLSKLCRSPTKAHFDNHFDAESCVLDLATDSKTHGFSGRELEKIIQGVLYKTYASDKGILDTSLWNGEVEILISAVRAKHMLKRSKNQVNN